MKRQDILDIINGGNKAMKSAQARAVDIPQRVKQKVWERDEGRCVVCGYNRNTMPNAHFIPRSKGGLGIEQNVVTLCTNFTPNMCHYKYDFGTKEEREAIGAKIEEYLGSVYDDWNKELLVYKH